MSDCAGRLPECWPSWPAGQRGFAFSVDAAVAVMMVVVAFYFFASSGAQEPISPSQSSSIIRDTFFALENSGYIVQTIDSNSNTESAVLIRSRILSYLPEGFDANVEVRSYTIDQERCASQQTFAACFPDANVVSGSAGSQAGAEHISGRSYFLRKQPPGDCNISYVSLSGEREGPAKYFQQGRNAEGALFSEAFFDEGDLNTTFDVNASPSDAVTCDQNISIGLSVSIPEDVRRPIDLMLVMDRSGSMSWDGQLDLTAANDVYVSGGYAYVADGSAGLRAIDISNPAQPSVAQTLDPGTPIAVHGSGNYVYVVETSGTDELYAYDISTPGTMSLRDSIAFEIVYGLYASGNLVYVVGDRTGTGNNRGLYIVDASNPANLVFRGHMNLTYAVDVFVSGNYAYVTRGSSGISRMDISNPDNIGTPLTTNPGGTANSVFVSGDYLYAAIGTSGLAIMSQNNMEVLAVHNTPGNAYDVKLYGDGNAYVADNTSLQVINVTAPSSPVLAKSYATPYSFTDVYISGNWAFLTPGYNTGLITYDIYNGPKINQAISSAGYFVDFNAWQMPPDQMGLVSFVDSATLDRTLTTNAGAVKSGIAALVANGGTNMSAGITTATAELNGARHNPRAIKFQVLLSDGQSSVDPTSAANSAAGSSITIYTIGFGGDADEAQLQNIAGITGGEYYAASDLNALEEVFALIALKVAEIANDSNVSVPVLGGALVVDDGNGMFVDGNLVFDAGTITKSTPFSTTYVLNFPCSSPLICGADAFTFPGPGTEFNYVGTDGNYHSADFNIYVTLPFRSRDLNVSVLGGSIVGKNDVTLDLLVQNTGELDANATRLGIRIDDTNGQLLGALDVDPLCSQETPMCTAFQQEFNSVNIGSEGVIYAVLNDDNSISECPIGNIARVNCYSGPETQVFAVDYSVWRQ